MECKNRVREFREILEVSRAELAARAGLTTRGLRLIETGENQPKLATARRIARALGTPLGNAFPEAGDE